MRITRTSVRGLLLTASSSAALLAASPTLAQDAPAPASNPSASEAAPITPGTSARGQDSANQAAHPAPEAGGQQSKPADANSAQGPSSISEVVVTGYRASLESALNAKRRSDLPIESIAPEDIGKFPDQNVAESLQRLPGVQIDRSQGEGTAVLIDGLRQNLTTLNSDIFLTGKEFYVSGEGSGGGSGGNAQYSSLEGVPSEEVAGIGVYKNPNAAITEGGLGGTIDLKTRDPLAQPMGFSFGGNIRGTLNDNEGAVTPDGTLVMSYKLSPRLAFTGSISYDEQDTHTKEYQAANRNAWVITDAATLPYTGAPSAANQTTLANGQTYIDPQLGYFTDIYDRRKILGASAGVAWKPIDSITTRVNYFHSREDDTSESYSDKVWFNGAGTTPASASSGPVDIPGINPAQPYAIDSNGVVQNATFEATGAETQSLYQDNVAQADNVQWITTFNNGGPIRGAFNAAYSHATSDLEAAAADVEHSLYDTSAGVATSPAAPGCNNGAVTCAGAGNPGYAFTYSNGGTSGLPNVHYLSDVLSNPNYTTFKSNWAWQNRTAQTDYALKGDVSYDIPYLADLHGIVSAGARYAQRAAEQDFGRYLIDGMGAGNVGGDNTGPYIYYSDPGYGTPNIPYSTAVSNPGLVKTVNNFGVGSIIVKSPGTLSNPATFENAVWNGAGVPNNTEKLFNYPTSSFRVIEDTTAGYVMMDLGGKENRFHANVGVRIVQTDLDIKNAVTNSDPEYVGTAVWNGVDANDVPAQSKRRYTDVLPSFNFTLDTSDKSLVRFSAARVVSPQDLFSLGLGNSFNFSRQTGTRINVNTGLADGFAFDGGSSGNPNLDPYRATEGLLSYENYFAPGSVVSIEGFWKQIDNFVEIENIPTLVNDDFGGTTSNVTEPVNAGSGHVYGIELSAQYLFTGQLSPYLKGFGFTGNYTYSNSQDSQATSFSTKGTIPGVSENSVTGSAFYERFGFSGRLSYSWRDKAVNDSLVGATFAFPGTNKVYQIYSAPFGELDGQIGYDFNAHLGLVFQVQNITNEAQHTYLQWPDQPFSYDDFGRRYFLGLKFKG